MRKLKRFAPVLFLIICLGVLAACNSTSGEASESSEGNGETDALSGSITVSGSSAMQPLIAAAAETFMNEHSEADIQVNAGGSGTGLSEVSEGTVDIGNSDVFAEEKDGIPAEELVDHKVAVVGMAPVVHPDTGIIDISKEDLIKVFTGEVTNWKELGGNNEEIILVNRPDSSGTRATFVTFGLDGATPAEGVTEDSSNTVRKIVGETPGAIGYLAFSYLTDDTVVPLSLDSIEANDENVLTGAYPIWAYQHAYTKGEATGLSKEFLDYLMSSKVQEGLLPDQGYIASTKMEVERDAAGNETKK